eukprot:478046_1
MAAMQPMITDAAIGFFIELITFLLFVFWIFKVFCNCCNRVSDSSNSNVSASSAASPTSVQSSKSKSTTDNKTNNESDIIEVEMYNMQNNKSTTKTQKKQLNIPLYAKIMATTHMALSVTEPMISVALIIDGKLEGIDCIISSINYHSVLISRLILFVYYMERTRRTFIGTEYEMKPINRKLIITWFIIGYQLAAVSNYSYTYLYGCWDPTDPNFLLFMAWPLLNEITISLFCAIYFVYKLRSLVNSCKELDKNTNAHAKIKYIMKKVTVLAVTSITCSILLVFSAAAGLMLSYPLETLIINVCLLLTFGFMDNIYRKFCCLCIKCC